ncbi:hypothetical protein RvY_18265 [Ramazzottius varieornatus]|uniref:Uncharacterized protein n=1 Tax=Ramazzottius varieornatus TaxID=947166 RepID=A0A1D1W539_RAMVA|nr:hypothetical protein RvY_18265 [Ramazzottius varieornatus]
MNPIPFPKRLKVSGEAATASSLKSKPSADVAGQYGNIHDIDNNVRLLSLSDAQDLYFEDVSLKGSALVAKTIKKLKDWRQSDIGVAVYNTVPPALTAFQDRLMKKGIDPLDDLEFLYRAVVYKFMSDEFPDQSKDIFSYFTIFIVNFPDAQAFLTNESMKLTKNILDQIDVIYPTASEEVQNRLATVTLRIQKLPWNISEADKNTTPNEEVVTLARNFARSRKVLDTEDVDLGRMLTRMGRISSNHGGAAAVTHRRKIYSQMRNCAGSDEVTDIEDAISLTAQKVCTERKPQCPSCPLKSLCNAYKNHLLIKNFVKLYLKSTSFLVYTPSRLCSEGNECLLCSPDVLTSGYCSSEGVTKYSMRAEDRVKRKHQAVCVIEDVQSKTYYFSKSEEKQKVGLVRIELPVDEKASSHTVSDLVENELAKMLPETTKEIKVSRMRKCDGVETKIGEKVVRVVYGFSVKVVGGNGARNDEKDVWMKGGDISPDRLSAKDWKTFQDCVFLSVDHQPPNAKSFQRKQYGLSDGERIRLLEEAHRKRFGNFVVSV